MFIYTNYNHLKTLEKSFGLRITKMERVFHLYQKFCNWLFPIGVWVFIKTLWEKELCFWQAVRGRCCVAWHSRIITVSVSATMPLSPEYWLTSECSLATCSIVLWPRVCVRTTVWAQGWPDWGGWWFPNRGWLETQLASPAKIYYGNQSVLSQRGEFPANTFDCTCVNSPRIWSKDLT